MPGSKNGQVRKFLRRPPSVEEMDKKENDRQDQEKMNE
jgi:hypothetical protein